MIAFARPMGRLERLYCERQAQDLARWPARTQEDCEPDGYWFDEAEGARVVSFVESYIRHHKGEWAGQPLILEDWEKAIIGCVFGWRNADGLRRFSTAYVEIARKNGKTEIAAALGLYLTIADGEPGAEVYSTATKRDQAKIMHDAATAMVKASPDLKRFVRTMRNNINCPETGSKFEPLGADGDTLDGLNAHGNLVDELHAHKNRVVWDVMLTSTGARRQPLTLAVTTAGVYDPKSIGWEQHDYACKVLEGVFPDESFFAYIAAADPDDDWTQPDTWYKANPNLGVSVKPKYLEQMCEKAQKTPSFRNTFERLHLNRWTQQLQRWIDMEKWKACGALKWNEAELLGRTCYGGLDLASRIDIAALVLVFPADDGFYDLLCRFWVPEETIQKRSREDRVPYDAWQRDGWLKSTPGDVIDYDFIHAEVVALRDIYEIAEIAYDPWNAQGLVNGLMEEGLTMVEMGQTIAKLTDASKEFEKLVIGEKLRHGNHPTLNWMANNVTTREDPSGNIRPDKSASAEKIDGIVAAVMGTGRALLGEGGASVYETRGILFL